MAGRGPPDQGRRRLHGPRPVRRPLGDLLQRPVPRPLRVRRRPGASRRSSTTPCGRTSRTTSSPASYSRLPAGRAASRKRASSSATMPIRYALTGVVSQVFMGVRISCAQCHNHPFDVWSRKQFYDLAAFFGKTQRVEHRVKMQILGIFLNERADTMIMWPPEDEGAGQASQGGRREVPVRVGQGRRPEQAPRPAHGPPRLAGGGGEGQARGEGHEHRRHHRRGRHRHQEGRPRGGVRRDQGRDEEARPRRRSVQGERSCGGNWPRTSPTRGTASSPARS